MGRFTDENDVIDKKKLKKFAKYIGNKTTEDIPEALLDKDNFVPILDRPMRAKRDLDRLNFLARTENPAVKIKGGGKMEVNLATGECVLPLSHLDSAQKKAAVYHVATHQSITPHYQTLDESQQKRYEVYKDVVEMLEDVRVNRVMCFERGGLLRYVREVDQKVLADLSIGDLDPGRRELSKEEYGQNALSEVLFENREIIRECDTYNDILDMSEAIWEQVQNKNQEKSNQDKCECGGKEKRDEYGWATGACEDCGKDKSPKPEDMKDMVKDIVMDGVDKSSTKDEDKGTALFGHDEATGNKHKFHPKKVLNDNMYGKNVVVKKQPSFFHGMTQDITPWPIGRRLLRHLQKQQHYYRPAKSGKLDKLNPVKMENNKRWYKRKNTKSKKPHFYFICDCSGSMGHGSQLWQKTIVTTFTKVLKKANIKYTILAHTGETSGWRSNAGHGKGELFYAELKDSDVPHMNGIAQNFDGSMVGVFLRDYADKKENSIVFYISDANLPAANGAFEGPELKKNLKIAKQKGIPIMAIGLGTASVSKFFEKWFVVKDEEDFGGAIKAIGREIKKSVRN